MNCVLSPFISAFVPQLSLALVGTSEAVCYPVMDGCTGIVNHVRYAHRFPAQLLLAFDPNEQA